MRERSDGLNRSSSVQRRVINLLVEILSEAMSRNLLLRLLLPFFMVSSVMPRTASLKLKVAAVQFRSSFDVAENRRRILETLEHLAEQGVKVAAFPECALTVNG